MIKSSALLEGGVVDTVMTVFMSVVLVLVLATVSHCRYSTDTRVNVNGDGSNRISRIYR